MPTSAMRSVLASSASLVWKALGRRDGVRGAVGRPVVRGCSLVGDGRSSSESSLLYLSGSELSSP